MITILSITYQLNAFVEGDYTERPWQRKEDKSPKHEHINKEIHWVDEDDCI